jgi:REP element-mobilizing transposase RayT
VVFVPREARFHEPGSYRHLTARANNPDGLFLDDADRWTFLRLLGEVTRVSRWRCLGWCLLTTHYHLLVQEGAQSLSTAMHLLHSRYVRAFNARHGRRGHVFAGRYHVTTIEDDAHLVSALRYVARNPIEAGLCSVPEDWPWSSYGQLTGAIRSMSFLSRAHVLSLFDPRPERAVELVRQFVEQVPGTSVPGTWLSSQEFAQRK